MDFQGSLNTENILATVGNSANLRDLFGMVSSSDPKSMANRCLQLRDEKRSRIESLGRKILVVPVFFLSKSTQPLME